MYLTFHILIGLLLLLAAAWHDILSRRIPNALVFPGAFLGLLLNAVLPHGLGVLDSLAGLGVGLLLLLPFYLLRVMGAGDVKLMAMVGAFLGVRGVTGSLLYIVLAGGVLALGMACREGKLRMLLQKLKTMFFASRGSTWGLPVAGNLPLSTAESADKLPYGVAIAAGTVAYLAAVHCA